MILTALDVLIKELEEQQGYLRDALIGGPLSSLDEVMFLRGQYRGLAVAVQRAKDLADKMESDE